jgi:hypothetical protein
MQTFCRPIDIFREQSTGAAGVGVKNKAMAATSLTAGIVQTVFGRFSARGVQKHHTNTFAKSPCRKLFPKQSTKISMSVFPRFFVLSRFRVFLSDESSKTLQKAFFGKIALKSFYKKIDQKSKTDLFSKFLSVFGEGS